MALGRNKSQNRVVFYLGKEDKAEVIRQAVDQGEGISAFLRRLVKGELKKDG